MPFPENEDIKLSEPSKVVNYRTLADVIDYFEIYPGSKIQHFSSLRTTTRIPHNEMIFFDDEMRNREVERELGVHFVHVPSGMTLELFLFAVKEFAKKRDKSVDDQIQE
jgi:magnesium-dependent phosphatase 1